MAQYRLCPEQRQAGVTRGVCANDARALTIGVLVSLNSRLARRQVIARLKGAAAVERRCRSALLVSRSAWPSCRVLGALDAPPLDIIRQVLRAEAHQVAHADVGQSRAHEALQ